MNKSQFFYFFAFVALLGLSVSISVTSSANEVSYQELSAAKKLVILQERVEAEPYEDLPSLKQGLGFGTLLKSAGAFLFLSKSFDHTDDEMPKGRAKVIHPLGSTATVVWNAFPNAYTGVFRTGGVGLARLSLAGDPNLLGFTPGMGLKILVNGNPSVNLQVMYSLDGQGEDRDFFANSFSNEIAAPTSLLLKPLAFLFSLVNDPPTYLSVDHYAAMNSKGQTIKNPKAPYALRFQPHADVIGRFAKDSADDFRMQLAELPQGTVLYEIWATPKDPNESSEELIGELILTSQFIASEYQDQKLFFQHHR